MSVLKKPIITEKSNYLMEKDIPQYGFEVDMSANKTQIKSEVERVYEVEVEKVRTQILRGKARSRFNKTGVVKGKDPNTKRAIVTLKPGFAIDFYKHI